MLSVETALSFRAENTTVSEFSALVDSKISSVAGSVNNAIDDARNKVNQTIDSVTEFGKSLYDRALSLPEAALVSLSSSVSASTLQYGTFSGSKVYSNWSGTVDANVKADLKLDGWLTLNKETPNYALLSNNDTDYIIGMSDFTPKSTVSDFQPLYDELKDKSFSDDLLTDDTKSASSLATTFRDMSSLDIINDSDQIDVIESNIRGKKFDESIMLQELSNVFFYGIYPRQIGKGPSENTKNDSVYNNIQAVIYDLPGYGVDTTSATLSGSHHQLFCYQQPDQISYNASAHFDSVSPRGSQQPFQFYNTANAISLSFTLKWHIDEIRTLAKDGQQSYTIQEIADIAEGFTRPWDVSSSSNGNESLQPKLCKVILPGVSQIGYITDANISFSGDMSGDYSTGGGVLTGSDNSLQERALTNYFYSQIEISFTMIVIKDVSLIPLSSVALGVKTILSDNRTDDIKPFKQVTYSDTYKQLEDTQTNVVTTYTPPDPTISTPKYQASYLNMSYMPDTQYDTQEQNMSYATQEQNMSYAGSDGLAIYNDSQDASLLYSSNMSQSYSYVQPRSLILRNNNAKV